MIIRKKINRVPRSPRVSSGIRPEGANSTANQEYLLTGEWYPDRTIAPLVLQPYVSYSEGTSGKFIENALPELTNGNWYRLDSSNRHLGICEATKISLSKVGTDTAGNSINVFTVVSTPGAANYGRLTVRENVPPNEEITYIFDSVLATNGQHIQEYYNSRCNSIVEVPDILFDNNATALFDPFAGEQYFTIKPSLSIDYPVTWKWMSYHELEGGWVDVCSTPLDWCIDKVDDGIKIDRFRMPDMIMLRCMAEVNVNGILVYLEKPVSHTRLLPAIEKYITRVGEIPEDVTHISPYALIKSGGKIISDDKEILVEWINSANTVIGKGLNPTIALSSLKDDMLLDLRVRDRGGRVALIDNGELITSNSSLILTRSKV